MPKKFDAEKINYVGPKVNKYKAKSVYINYNGKNPLIFKTPNMNCPFGVSTFTTEGTDSYTKYSLDCSFNGMDKNSDIKAFYDALNTLDNKLIEDGCKNSLAWFTKKKLSKEVAKEFYQSNIRYSTDRETGEINTEYAPRFKVKVPVRYGRVDCKVWRDLPWGLEGWSTNDLSLMELSDLQTEAEHRGIDVDTTLSTDEIRETLVSGLFEWSTSTSKAEKESMRGSHKHSHPVELKLKPEHLDTQMKRVSVSLLVKLRSIWFTGGKFGCSWEALHMKIKPVVDLTPTLEVGDVDVSNINFTDPRVNKYGGKSVSLKHGDFQLRMKLPLMPLPFGVSKYTPEGGEASKYTIDVSFRDKEDNEDVRAVYDFFTSLDEKMISSACENSLAWFTKKKVSPEVVEAILRPSLKWSTNRETGERLTQYAPRFSAKIPFWNGNLKCKIRDEDGNEFTGLTEEGGLERVLSKGSSVEMSVRCSSLWLGSGRFGLTWDATDITVYPGETLDSFRFDDEDDVAATIISDSDDSEEEEEEEVEVEEEEEEEEEEESEDELEVKPPTPPPAKKRRGRRKKVTATA